MNTTRRHNRVLEIIQERLVPDDVAKKARGEVFTPLDLVREMLFGLRKSALAKGKNEIWGMDMSGNFIDESEDNRLGGIPLHIWRDAESTFLDPANGIGNFPVVAFSMLDYQLGKHGKDKKYRGDVNKDKRRKHIAEKMLFMIEIDKGNVNTARKIFKNLVPNATPNVCCADSKDMKDEQLKKHFGINRFDVIFGNPPYQPSQLWEKFIINYITKLVDNGYLCFVVPSSWTSYTSDSWKILNKYSISLINNSNYLKTKYFPKVGSTFSYFIVKKTEGRSKTLVINDFDQFQISIDNTTMLPKIITPLSLSINDKVLVNKLDGTFDRKDMGTGPSSRDNKNDEYKYPFITFVKPGGQVDIKYLKSQDPKQNKKKVLLFRSGYINPYFDDGKYGVGDNIHALIVKSSKEGNNLVKLFKSELYTYIWDINKHSQYNHGGLMNKVFRDIDDWDNVNDDIVYTKLHISKDEQTFIKEYLSKKKRQGKTLKNRGGGETKKPIKKATKTRRVRKGLLSFLGM